MTQRGRYLLAAVLAAAAGLLAYLQTSQPTAPAGGAATVWVASTDLAAGTRLTAGRVAPRRTTAVARDLLAPRALPERPGDEPGQWLTTRPISAGGVLQAGINVAQVLPGTPAEESAASELRFIWVPVSGLKPGQLWPGERVDLYAHTPKGPIQVLGHSAVADLQVTDEAAEVLFLLPSKEAEHLLALKPQTQFELLLPLLR